MNKIATAQNKLPLIGTILASKKLDTDSKLWQKQLDEVKSCDVERVLSKPQAPYNFQRLLVLLSPAAQNYLEQMAQLSQQLTLQRFGRTIKFYAPLYLSNYCSNSCKYCGFNKQTDFKRTRLSIEEAVKEAEIIAAEGFRDILLVSGEDRKFITINYLSKLAKKLKTKFSSISLEIYQADTTEYAKLFEAGIDGVTLYQETYNRQTYADFHPKGPKSDYDYRLDSPDRIGQAGMRQIGLGALLGLSNWRTEALALGEHAHYLMKRYWQSQVSISFPRLRPAHAVAGQTFKHLLSDKDLIQMITALRLCFADVGLVLSTRERAQFRNHLIKLGITKLSAGSKTNPGGYSQKTNAIKQFEIDDDRSAAEVAAMVKKQGLEPVWKDWDSAFAK